MFEGFLEAYEYAVTAGEPDECAKQFVSWTKKVASGLASCHMQREYELWIEAQKDIHFYSDESSFPAQTESMKALLIGMLMNIEEPDSTIVDPGRINELYQITSSQFDLSKLIRLCEELNICYANECYFAVVMLARAIVDHIPPIFGYKTFKEVANNYSGGSSFKKTTQNLEHSLKNIANIHLHQTIRTNESLPNQTQVNFSTDLDMLLSEIVRCLK